MFLLKILFFFVTTLLLKTSGEAEYCKKILAELGNAESNFAYCATTHSVPVEICNGCKKEYDSMKDIFVNFSNDVNCTSRYFDKDRVNLVTTTEESLSSLWTKAYCDDCFRNENIFKFNEKITALEGCIGSNSKHPCESCIGDYKDLNNFYIQMDQHNNGGVCFDIQDSVCIIFYQWL
uniref:Uncharacterized protein n=1 Tax=Stomoxys calcitrans TaxID=35570 RepID=A0A1I8PHB5_STOCA